MKSARLSLCAVGAYSLFILVNCLFAAEGDVLWFRTYGGANNQTAANVIQCGDGGYALAATDNFGGGGLNTDFLLIRTDAAGNELWIHAYGDANYDDQACTVVQTNDGGFAVAGTTSDDYNMLLYRTNAQGSWIWRNTYGTPASYDECNDLIHLGDDGFALVGKTNFNSPSGFSDMYLVRTDPVGNQLWQTTWGYQNQDEGAAAGLRLVNGHYILAGFRNDGYMSYVLELDSLGLMSGWYPDNDSTGIGFVSVTQTNDGSYLLASTIHDDLLADQMRLTRVGSTFGYSFVYNDFGGAWPESGMDAVESPNGGYLICGSSMTFGQDYTDLWMVKTDANLDSVWSKSFYGGGISWANSVIVNSDGDYILAGALWMWADGYDALLVCVEGHPTAVEPVHPEIQPSAFILHPCHPNPFNPSTVISFELRAVSYVQLEVFDINGRAVGADPRVRLGGGRTPALQEVWYPAGAHQIPFDGSNLPSGIYFAKLTAGESANWRSQVQKLVLLK